MKREYQKRGFTVMELIMAMAVSGMLLAALATAFTVSANSVQENQRFFNRYNQARQALCRMTKELRDATSVDTYGDSSMCHFQDASGDYKGIYFDSYNQVLTLNGAVLCDHVTEVRFTKKISDYHCERVQISLTVSEHGESQTFTACAVPRRNL